MTEVARWIRERVPLSGDQLRALTNEPVPNHMKHWWFCLGGTPAYLFVVQIVTGILLAIYYQPSSSTAYESIQHINESDKRFGAHFQKAGLSQYAEWSKGVEQTMKKKKWWWKFW